ncbi:MAG: helix-turn-helix domain-containing protein [Phreatobacter sp.]
MTKAKDLHEKWMADPAYRAEYEALGDEFALVEALMKAREHSGLTQDEIARRMGTTQSVVARLEGGKTMPSTRTLKKYAEATGTKLVISFEPAA